jgi:ribose transport system permease protein
MTPSRPENAKKLDRDILRGALRSRITLIAIIDALFVLMIWLINPDFARWQNFVVIIDNMALPAIVMVPTVMLLAAGRFDLSIDGVAALAGMTAGLVLTNTGLGTLGGILAGLLVGLLIGLVNGVLIERFDLNPLVTTLATWWIAAGTAVGVAGGTTVYGFPTLFQQLGQTRVGGTLISTWYAVVICVVAGIVLSLTKVGYHIFAVGGNRDAARLNGINTRKIGLSLYALSGVAAAFAGVVFAGRLNGAGPSPFDGLSLTVIAGAVIGGASIYGGRGSIAGAVLGLFLLSMLGNAAIYVGISPFWQKAISGVVLLFAVVSDLVIARFRSSQESAFKRIRQFLFKPPAIPMTSEASSREG